MLFEFPERDLGICEKSLLEEVANGGTPGENSDEEEDKKCLEDTHRLESKRGLVHKDTFFGANSHHSLRPLQIPHWFFEGEAAKSTAMSAPETRVSLIMRVRDVNDKHAWTEFVSLYSPVVYAFVRSRGMREADAEDITQEVFRSLAKALPNFELDKSIGTFRNWLFTVTRSKLNNHLAKSRKLPVPTEHLPDQGDVSDWDNLYMKELFRHACEKVEEAVEPSSWQVFWRTAVDLQSPDEVARDLNLSVANVYQKRSRVATRLREAIRMADEEVLSEPPPGAGIPV